MDCYRSEPTSENIKVYVRLRPFLSKEEDPVPLAQASGPSATFPVNGPACLEIVSDASTRLPTLCVKGPHHPLYAGANAKNEFFSYDYIGSQDTSQEELFHVLGKVMTDNCLQGYNGTIFAYGQTGSGKTYTMLGPQTEDGHFHPNDKGLIPRILEYLFFVMSKEEKKKEQSIKYLCKCSFVEIYNENIYDLLDPASPQCALREDIKRGVYVDGNLEELVNTPEEALKILELGSRNRHVAATAMNRESSRSHSVFTLNIQSRSLEASLDGLTDVRESRFHLVDLAGSERQQLTGTTGLRLKEAGNINKSLLALGNVINALVDIANGKARHVHYRDSKLTFLLRDSLGGNAKTFLIANVNPLSFCYAETLSTLRFAQRAKLIRNKAIVNKDVLGNVGQLQAEIKRLKDEVKSLKDGIMPLDKLSYAGHEQDGTPEGFSMVLMALQRQKESEDEKVALEKRLELLDDLYKKKELQVQSEKMIIKFRDSTIALLRKALKENSALSASMMHDEEKEYLRNEVLELKSLLEHHPEVTRFAYENIQLQEKLVKMEQFAESFLKYEEEMKRFKLYEQSLSHQILLLSKHLESASNGSLPLHEEASSPSILKKPSIGASFLTVDAHIEEVSCLKQSRQELEMKITEKEGIIEHLQHLLDRSKATYEVEIDNLKNMNTHFFFQ